MNFEETEIDKRPISSRDLPDISIVTQAPFAAPLARVGMEKIEMPVRIDDSGLIVPARVDAYVSLDQSQARGIHMSRLYLDTAAVMGREPLCAALLKQLLEKFLARHEDLSQTAEIVVRFELPVERKALLSHERGYRLYPISVRAVATRATAPHTQTQFRLFVSSEIIYSSTCPCSTSLAKELARNQFILAHAKREVLRAEDVADWLTSPENEMATPHAQRSVAKVNLEVNLASPEFASGFGKADFLALIDLTERALGTPVQAAVKRVDEQEFAKLNGENLMFCEDAARKLRAAFETSSAYCDYEIYVEHQESLHPHAAVAKVVKGVAGGYHV